MNRREFLAAAGGLVATATVTSERQTAMMPVIDTHQHLWDLAKFRLNWLKKGDPLDASFTPNEYAKAIDGLNVVKAVYMEVDVVLEQQDQEADYIVSLCESGKTPTTAAVISGRPNSDGFARSISRYKGHRYVKGLRQVLHVGETTPEYYLDPKFVKGIQALGELGLSFDLCIRPVELPEITKLVDRCPDTRFILDHCGNPNATFTSAQWAEWRKNMTAIARRTNVVCKVSGFIVNGWEKGRWKTEDLAPAVHGTIEAFGWDRVMFGGDWPVCTLTASYREWLTALRTIIADQPVENQRKLLHDNAARFYGI